MKPLTFQFSTGSGFGSALIRWRTDSEFSHVDVARTSPDGQIHALIGARMDGGVLTRPVNYGAFTKIVRVTVPVTDEQSVLFWAFIRSQLGKPYDKLAILGLAAFRNWKDDKKWFCSELQAAACQAAGILRVDAATNFISPEILRLMLMELPGATEVRG